VTSALDDYWSDIEHHNYLAAFGYFAPGAVDVTEAEFISSEEQLDITSVSFKGVVTAAAKSSATVGVISLVTHDREHGCRTWSGSYTMVLETGFWRILHAALSPQRC
jgi:hypothetical protein